MALKLDWRRGAQENAASYYSLAKELAAKERGAASAIEGTKQQLKAAESEKLAAEKPPSPPAMRRRKEWFEKYRWFFSSGGKVVVAGRDAKQNDLLFARTMAEGDLFFHADIQGAPATILVGGKSASRQEKLETAQFAASHSSAWKVGAAAVDVYAVGKSQLSKHAQGGFVGAGGFAISGEREWFRETPLGLAIGKKDGAVICLPSCHPDAPALRFLLSSGSTEKGKAAAQLAKSLGASPDEILLAIPSGGFSLKERK